MNDKDVLRYLELVDKKLSIAASGMDWEPEQEEGLEAVEEELSKLRELIEEEHRKGMKG